MPSWKERVSDKLTNLFSDSPPSSSSPASPHYYQARSHSNDGNYLSSILSFVRPSSENDLKQIQSSSTRWNSRSISWKHRPLDTFDECDAEHGPNEGNGEQSCLKSIRYEETENSNSREENGDQRSGRSTSSSEEFEDVADVHTLEKSVPALTLDSLFISSELYQFLQSSLPNIVKGCQWVLLYSSVKHGISLRTLIRKSSDLSGPCLLITGDTQGAVFGGLLNCPLTPTPKRKYQGSHQTFVFTTLYGAPRLFRPTGANRYFYMCLSDMLALGGGGKFALSLDGDLLTGTSGACDTFGNQCLAHNEEFALKNVELWGFAHSSRYP